MMHFPLAAVFILLSTLVSATPAAAHVAAGAPADFLAGFFHPASGLDHIVAIVSLGAWTALIGGRALWVLPLAFLVGAGLGGSLAASHMPLPVAEPLIVASAVFFLLLALARARFHSALATTLTLLFAMAHGHAHSAGLPDAQPLFASGFGFLVGSGLLILSGIAMGRGWRRYLTSSTDVRAPRTTS